MSDRSQPRFDTGQIWSYRVLVFFGGILVVRSTIWEWFQGLFFQNVFNLRVFEPQLGLWCNALRPRYYCSFKDKRNKSDFYTFLGLDKTKTTTKTWDEIGQLFVHGALNDTKQIRKAGADIFANFGAEKP